ncbi:hypothetical protein [Streptomyces sp. NPDC057939]|uniref:hypothetical protein n=1 Tax=Streptomyces sp. NPDC057939 TaxID=3346284 RepID=UPI0036E9C136
MTQNRRRDSPVEHGFPHLETVRASLTALFRRLGPEGVRTYATSFAAADAAFDGDDDLHLGAHRVASAMVRALGQPDARVVVEFRPMRDAATVDPTAGPECFESHPDGQRVSFPRPVGAGRMRVTVPGPQRVRCGVCRTVLECDT